MELEGFGVSLVGRCVYICSEAETAWLPWEFLSASYTCRILICGDVKKSTLFFTQTWTAVFTPVDPKVWSAIATVLKGLGQTALIVFDSGCPEIPTSFTKFMEDMVASGRHVLTRVCIGKQCVLPTVPDAIFFPTGFGSEAYDYLAKMPARNGHGTWSGMSVAEFKTLNETVTTNNLGFIISDIEERGWTLFWHREADSAVAVASPKKLVETLLMATSLLVRTLP
jgi:hypothetical protein